MGQKFQAVQSFILQKCDIACLGFCTTPSAEAKTAVVSLDCWSLKFLAGMLILYVGLIKLAVWTFVTTYLLSAKTIIYFLLRKEIDSTDVTDVYLEEKIEEKKKYRRKKPISFFHQQKAPKRGVLLRKKDTSQKKAKRSNLIHFIGI